MIWKFGIWAGIGLGLIACTPVADDERPEPVARTVLAYVGSDNDLQAESYARVDSIAAGWKGGDGHLLIYHDTDAGASLYEAGYDAAHGRASLRRVAAYGAENSASGAVFARVLADMVRRWPARSYGLVVFSHGSGWLPGGWTPDREAGVSAGFAAAECDAGRTPAVRSVVRDGDRRMELAEFATAIPDGLCDFIVFESCLMAGVEVAYALRDKTDYVVASPAEVVAPGFIPVYPRLVECLFEPEPALAVLARTYYEQVCGYVPDLRAATVSVIRTDRLEALAQVCRAIVAGAGGTPEGELPDAALVGDVQHFDRYDGYRLFFDLEDYMERMAPPAQAARLREALDGAVVCRYATPDFLPYQNGFAIGRCCGLTTYIMQEGFPGLNEAYRATEWARAVYP